MRRLLRWTRVHLTGVVVAMLVPPLLMGQERRLNQQTTDELLRQLQSTEWTERATGFYKLRSDSRSLNRPDVRRALLSLLEAELTSGEKIFRTSLQGGAAPMTYGEEYAEYVGWVGQTVDGFADWNDPHQACLLIHQAYNPDGAYARKIASHPRTAVPCLLTMFGSDLGGFRRKAAPIFVQILATRQSAADAQTTEKMKQVIRQALRDPDDGVRVDVIVALDRFGGEDMIPALKQVADTDPAPEVQGHSIRKRAAEAITSIQKRAAQKTPKQ